MCAAGHPWQRRYVMKVDTDEGERLLELGGPQAADLEAMELDGGVFGSRIRLEKAQGAKSAKLTVKFVEREQFDSGPVDLDATVGAVWRALPDPPKRGP